MRTFITLPLPLRHHGRQGGQSVVEFALVLPIMVILLIAIVDFSRIYTTMMSVESAAREAADYGTTLGAARWQPGPAMDETVREMEQRACVATSNLPDYEDADNDPINGCTNPIFDYCVTSAPGGTCDKPPDPGLLCDDPDREPPCRVTVELSYDFSLFAPVNIEMFGVKVGFPSTFTVVRDSTYAMTDIDLATPAP